MGQGDATLIAGPDATWLIDAGDRVPDGGAIVEQQLLAQGLQLDGVVVTHADADHLGGFVTQAQSTSVLWAPGCVPKRVPGFLVEGPIEGESKTVAEWQACAPKIEAAGAERIVVRDGQHLGRRFSLGGGFTLEIVAGDGWVIGQAAREKYVNTSNERSVAVLVAGHGFELLVTGDLIGQPAGDENARVEPVLAQALEARGTDLEVLRIGHHGAANATAPETLARLRPEVAVISVGDGNRHQHPRCATYETLARFPLWVLQTQRGAPECSPAFQPLIGGHWRLDVVGSRYRFAGQDQALECDLGGCVVP